MAAGTPSATNTAHLTFLRFVAASVVVAFHFGWNVESLAWGNALWHRANAMVSFFFVLSGFILAHVYAARRFRAADFYVARIARVLPVYLIALFLVVLFEPRQDPVPTWWVWISALLIQSWWIGYSQILNIPGWSLSDELSYYLLFPMLLRWISRLRTSVVLATAAAAWALNITLHWILFPWTDPVQHPYLRDFTYYSPVTHLATFVVGIAGGIVFHRANRQLGHWAIPLMLGSGAALLGAVWLPDAQIHYLHQGLLAPLFVLFLWGFGSRPDLLVARVLRWTPLVMLGEASYGVYILQLPLRYVYLHLVGQSRLSPDAYFWLYYALLVLASVLTLKWVDAPLRRAIKRVYSKRLQPLPVHVEILRP